MLVDNFFKKINIEGEGGLSKIPIRKGFGDGLVLAGKENSEIVVLSADLTDSTQLDQFKKVKPENFFEIGVAEQNMASVASGMAAMGKIPFIASYATFSPGRNWEQIRTTICYNNVPVKIVGHHAGLSTGFDGGTHQALEDVAIMRVLPNMVVVVPCDAIEAKKATLAISRTNSPAYLRVFREKTPVITKEETPFEIGKANILYQTEIRKERNILIIANGEMIYESLCSVKDLELENIGVCVLNMHTVKPLDTEKISTLVKDYKNIVVIEEHQVSGGLGSAILEELAELNLLKEIKVRIIGIQDRFGQSGTKEDLRKEYGIDEGSIYKKIVDFL